MLVYMNLLWTSITNYPHLIIVTINYFLFITKTINDFTYIFYSTCKQFVLIIITIITVQHFQRVLLQRVLHQTHFLVNDVCNHPQLLVHLQQDSSHSHCQDILRAESHLIWCLLIFFQFHPQLWLLCSVGNQYRECDSYNNQINTASIPHYNTCIIHAIDSYYSHTL